MTANSLHGFHTNDLRNLSIGQDTDSPVGQQQYNRSWDNQIDIDKALLKTLVEHDAQLQHIQWRIDAQGCILAVIVLCFIVSKLTSLGKKKS